MDFETLITNNRACSASFAELGEVLLNNPQLQQRPFGYKSENMEPFMHFYDEEHRVSPWACIIDKTKVQEMTGLVKTLPGIIDKALRRLLRDGEAAFCDYLNVTEIVADLFKNTQFNAADLSLRFDAVVHNQEFKIVESNSGASLGGWQMDFLQKEVMSAFKESQQLNQLNIKHHNVCESLFRALNQCMTRIKGIRSKGNVLFFLSNEEPQTRANLEENFQKAYTSSKSRHHRDGKIYFIDKLEDMEVTPEGRVYCHGQEMDAVLLTTQEENEVPDNILNILEAAALNGHFYYPDLSSLTLQGNKLIFALLHEPYMQAYLSDSERELVNRHIPWSSRIVNERVNWQGKTLAMTELLSNHKQVLLLKKAHSMQGKDVLMGHSCTPEQWQQHIDKVKSDPDWIVQSYFDPDPVLCSDPVNKINAYRMVWGFFSFGGNYGGCFLRGVPAVTDSSVINSANGAVEFLIFEEQKKKMLL
ncbi:hypothetical protein [Thalassomonas sp. RHCl1]|uniref:hypothetical protein n=1 Tax=Thalassomonas sp. RHCl1 TaxID=2995320 RepID=UPI00248CA77F|nr:hypothetical protein [Thalassomonas sp. RHCl1]